MMHHYNTSSMAVANDEDVGSSAHSSQEEYTGPVDVDDYLPSPNSVAYRHPPSKRYNEKRTKIRSIHHQSGIPRSSSQHYSTEITTTPTNNNRQDKYSSINNYDGNTMTTMPSPTSVLHKRQFDIPQQSIAIGNPIQSLSSLVTLNTNNKQRLRRKQEQQHQGPVDVDDDLSELQSHPSKEDMDYLMGYELPFPMEYLSLVLHKLPQSSQPCCSPTIVSMSDVYMEDDNDGLKKYEEDEHTLTTITADSSDAGDRMSTITLKTTAVHSVQTDATHVSTTSSTLAKERIQETVSSMNNIDACFHIPDARYNPIQLSLQQEKILSLPVNVDFVFESNPAEISSFAQIYIDAKRYSEAIDIYETVLDSCPQYHSSSLSSSALSVKKKKRKMRRKKGRRGSHGTSSCSSESKYDVDFVASTLHNLSVIHLKMENYEKALICSNEVLLLRRQRPERNALKIASSLINLGILYYATEKFNKSLSLLQEALQITSQQVGYDNASIASILNNIGCVHFSMGKLIASLATFEESLDIQRNSMGSVPSEDVDRTLLHISFTLCNAGIVSAKRMQFDTAASLVEEGLVVQQSVLPDTHRIVIGTQYTLSDIQNEDMRRGIDSGDNIHGRPCTIDTCIEPYSLRPINSCCSKMQWEEESCKPYCKGDIRFASLSELKSFTDTLKLGPLQDEMTIEERVMILVKAECIDDDFLMYENVYYDFTADSEHIELWNDAVQHFRRHNLIETIQSLENLRQKQKDKYGDVHRIVGSTHHFIGLVYLYGEKYAFALSEFQEAISIQTATHGPYHDSVLVSMIKAGMAMLLLRDIDNALSLFNQVLSIRRKKCGYNHPSVAIVLNSIGICHYHLGGLLPSMKSFEEAMEIQRDAVLVAKKEGKTSDVISIERSLSNTLSNIGFIRFQREQFAEAIVSLEEALELQRKYWGKKHVLTNETLTNLAFVMASSNCQDNHDKLRDMTQMYVSMLMN